MKQYVPLNDYALIECEERAKETKSGLYVGDALTKDQIFYNAKVLATGPGWLKTDGTRIPYAINVGDDVVVSQNGFMTQVPNMKNQYIIKMNAIWAKGKI